MKVLRTALLSVFMVLYFMGRGHAQFNQSSTFQIPMSISNMSTTSIGGGQVLVEYAIIAAPSNSVTTIKYEGLTTLYTEVVSGTVQVSQVVTIDVRGNSDEVKINCVVCKEDGSECRTEGCVVEVNL